MDADIGAVCKSATLELTIIRADGRREPLGVVAYYHKNPLRRAAWKLWRKLKEFCK